MGPTGSAGSPFIFNDAIIGLAQSLTEAVNQLASGLRRARDLIEELGRRENFYLDRAGGSSSRAAGTVFHNTHLPDKLPRANRAEKDALAIEFPEYLDGTADKAKNMARRVPLFEEDFPFSEVLASLADLSINNEWRILTSGNYHACYSCRIFRNSFTVIINPGLSSFHDAFISRERGNAGGIMATARIVVCSSYGIACTECKELVFAPNRSRYVDRNEVRHLWTCEDCGHETRHARLA